jgi:two-component system, NarL family, nitrate/nitrite response regulator NarL
LPTDADTPIRILLVDDHKSFVEAMTMVIDTQRPRMEVISSANNREDALTAAERECPDVILLDMDLGNSTGLELLPELQKVCDSRVLFLTGTQDPALHKEAILKGGRGVILKTESAKVILRAIERVHEGEIWASNATLSSIFDQLNRRENGPVDPEIRKIASLTAREREIIGALVNFESSTNEELAHRLFISNSTLKNHLTTIYSKLGLANRVQLLKYALKHKLAD